MKLSDITKVDIAEAKIEMDANGHYRVIFTDETLAEVNKYLREQMTSTYDDWIPRWMEAVENLETYRTIKVPIPDGGQSIYPAPIARIPADQIVASVYNDVMRSTPIFSWDAYLNATYNVPSQPVGPMMPQGFGPAPVATEPVESEKAAKTLQKGYEFVVRERIDFPSKLLKGIKGAVTGSPYWWKVVYDPEQKTTIGPKVDGAIVDLNDKYEETRLRGDRVRWYLVPYTNGMYPVDADSIDTAPWFAERTALDPKDIAKRYATGSLFLVKDDAEAATLVSNTVEKSDIFKKRSDLTTEKKSATNAIQVCDTWFPWFYWDVKYIDPEQPTDEQGKTVYKIKKLSLNGDFHLGAGKLMTCYLNNYEHQSRPFELVDQMDDGDCTVGRLKYHQQMFTYAAQSEIRNAHTANNIGYWHDPNNPDLETFFSSNKVIAMGQHVPGIKDKEWGTYRAGEQHYSLLELLKFFLSMSQLDSRENDFTMGGRPPGRTAVGTVQAVYQHAEETKTMFLARLSLKLSRLLRLDAETRRQYQPLGEVLPVWDDDSKKTIEIPFRFPIGDVLDNFRVALTAADEALTEERDPQQVMLRKQALMEDGKYVAEVVSALMNIGQPLPPSAAQLFAKIAMRDQKLMRKLMGQMVTDEENYDLTKEIQQLVAERNAALMAQQAQPQVMNAQGPTGPQPPNPAGPPNGGVPNPNQGMPGQPGVPVPPPQAPAPVSGTPSGPPVQ